jgi:methylmalonyl-CoA carboxyltransferase large subunit
MATRTSTNTSKAAIEKLAATLDELKAQIAAISERVAALEGPVAPAPAPVEATPAPAPPQIEEEISPEILMAISAAVAAYLGERPHIRAIRLVGTSRWSQEGRVSIQASHRLNRV